MPAERFAAMFRPEDMRCPTPGARWTSRPCRRRFASRSRNDTAHARDANRPEQRAAPHRLSTTPTWPKWTTTRARVLAALRELELEKDTIVLYTTDHGEMLGEHGLWQKFQFYEPSVGVPLIVRSPGR